MKLCRMAMTVPVHGVTKTYIFSKPIWHNVCGSRYNLTNKKGKNDIRN